MMVGALDGECVGVVVVGATVVFVGVGAIVGLVVSSCVGVFVGVRVGAVVGACVGTCVGRAWHVAAVSVPALHDDAPLTR